jgi:hypothetical protein
VIDFNRKARSFIQRGNAKCWRPASRVRPTRRKMALDRETLDWLDGQPTPHGEYVKHAAWMLQEIGRTFNIPIRILTADPNSTS